MAFLPIYCLHVFTFSQSKRASPKFLRICQITKFFMGFFYSKKHKDKQIFLNSSQANTSSRVFHKGEFSEVHT